MAHFALVWCTYVRNGGSMQTTVQLLDAVKAAKGISSDYALAPVLGMTRGAVSNYRQGTRVMDDVAAMKVADALGVDPAYVVACVHAERAVKEGDDARAAMWEIVAGKFQAAARRVAAFARAAAVLVMAVLLSLFVGGGPDGGAVASPLQPDNALPSLNRGAVVHYVKCDC